MANLEAFDKWVVDNRVREEMTWRGAALREFQSLAAFAEELGGHVSVVGYHTSKSIKLPVMEVTTPYGVRVIVRDNFHDIKVSVWAPKPCNHDLFGLPAGGDSYLHQVYFEGFQEKWIHPPFMLGAKEFSVCLYRETFLPFAKALRWYFETVKNKDPNYPPNPPEDDWIHLELERRQVATNSFFPVLYHKATVSALFRFFETAEEIEPDGVRLRRAFTQQAPGYDGKVSPKPIPYLNLDFTSGCPKPVDSWIRMLHDIIGERRTDPEADRLGKEVGARVNVLRLTPQLRNRAEDLGCKELLRKPDHR